MPTKCATLARSPAEGPADVSVDELQARLQRRGQILIP
jgi:hypothetical protein